MDNEIDPKAGGATRREFIKKASTAAAAVATARLFKTPVYGQNQAPSTGRVIGANDRIVVGFVGLGNQGLNSHLKPMVASSQANNLAIAAVCDVSKHRRDEAQQAAGGASVQAFEDYRQLLENKDIDAIVCATVDHWHARVSMDSMKAGKHIYVEKPMSRYLGEALQVHDTVKYTGKVFQVGSQGCSDMKWHKAAEWIRAGKIGPVVMCQGSYMRNTPKGEWNYNIQEWANANDINWKMWMGDQIKDKKEFDADDYFRWRKYYPYCAGLLSDLFPHKLHPYMLATGNPEFPLRVEALGTRKVETDKLTPGTPMRDSPEILQLIAEFPSGMVLNITSSSVNEVGTQEMIRGQKATLTLASNVVELKPERPFSEEIDPETSEPCAPESIPAHHKNWFDCIRNGKAPNANIDLAIRVQTVISLGEMSERLKIACLFDEKTRKVSTGDGSENSRKNVDAITYGTLERS